jgi:hypothetical protein
VERPDDHRFEEPPVEALQRGPVWLVDAVRGHRERVAEHAALAGETDELLVLYDARTLAAVVRTGDIVAYETLAADDARRIHGGEELDHEHVTLVYALSGVWD